MKKYILIWISLVLANECFATNYGVSLNDLEKLTALTNHYIAKEPKVKKPAFPNKPRKPLVPKSKKLVKGKYEKLEDFEKRIASEKIYRLEKLKNLERIYTRKVKSYNQEVKRLTDDFNNRVTIKQQQMKEITFKAMQKAYFSVYGTPYLAKGLKYDTENEIFYGKVKSTKGDFSERVAIPVPIAEAKSFEQNIKSLNTTVLFDFENNKLTMKKIVIKSKNDFFDKPYIAMLSAENYKSKNISVAINNGSLNLPTSPLLSASLALSESDYNIGTINYSADPEIARLQKQKYELEKKQKTKQQSKRKKEELSKQREALESQIALLEQNSGGVDDIPALLKKVKTSKQDSKKWLFIIAIENYEYTDSVAYSANSAKEFKKVMKKRVGIPEKNIRTLINKGATSGKIRFKLKDMLARVKKGDTIYFYYSGHGIPVPAQKNTPYLLAQDMSPAYVGDDEKFKLQNIYKSLSSSKATKVIAFVDSCFSGGTDNQSLIKGVAATRIKPKNVTFDKSKMLVISAGSGTQYSNKYDEKSNRLFSYYLMKGLIKNNSNTSKLYDYIKLHVAEKSYEMGESYEQTPVYNGNLGLRL